MCPPGSRNYVGVDPSLRSTGIASICIENTRTIRQTILIQPPTKMKGVERLVYIRNTAQTFLETLSGNERRSVIEGPSLYSVNRADDLGSVRGILKIVLADWGTHLPEEIPPTSLKKFATGSGNAIKNQIINAAKKEWGILTEDEADAAWLAEFALVLHAPTKPLTKSQLEAIHGIRRMKYPKRKKPRLKNIINI